MPTVLRALLLAAVLTLVPVTIGVVVADGDEPPARKPAAYQGTALQDFDTSKAVVRRGPFCDRVHPDAVRAALGGEGQLSAYDNGEPASELPGGEDVAHEYGCVFAGDDGAQARAWVFAPPVTTARAQALLEEAPGRGCKAQAGAPAYGAPSAAVVCTSDGASTATYRGLFGDAWLSCSLTLPAQSAQSDPAALLGTAGRWCVAVAQAASAT